jgi:predicted transposase YbfD/YdcC
MDQEKYSTLLATLQEIPDPRQARGRRYAWSFLLTLICAALASGQQTGHAIAHWVTLHAHELQVPVQSEPSGVPSESTLRRVLRRIDIQKLEYHLAHYADRLAAPLPAADAPAGSSHPRWQGQAIDGKAVRGVQRHGQKLHLVSLVRHDDAMVLAQVKVDDKSNEITAVPRLLEHRDLQGIVITMDALLTQRELAQQIVNQQGHYLLVVKQNQGNLYRAIELLFNKPPWLKHERATMYQRCRTFDKGHGRLETRVLESSPALSNYLNWPGIGQVLRRQCKRVNRKTGEVSLETTYGITSLRFEHATAMQLEALWRGHWTIENRVHRVRDVTMGEDACQIHTTDAPQVLAALRNAILNVLRSRGWTNIADAFRYHAASVSRALDLIGAAPARL